MEIALNLDLSDPPRYHVGTCDEAWIDSIFAKCARHGVTRMLWRVSLGRAYYPSRVLKPVDRGCGERWAPVAEVLERMDPLKCAVDAARRHGVGILAWYPFTETHVSKAALQLIDPFFAERRDLFWLNQDASRCFLGQPCLAEPEARDRLTAVCRELSDYGVDGIFLSTRTHCPRPGLSSRRSPNPEEDEFGFNSPIVKEVLSRTGVDISMVPVKSLDPQVRETWHRVKGESLTQWLREVRAVLRPKGQQLFMNIKPDRYGYFGNGVPANIAMKVYKDWETWIGEDLVDGLCAVTQRDFSPEPNVASIEPFTCTVPDGPFYVWTMNQYGRPPDKAASRVMDYGNWYARPPEVLDQVLAKVARQGARGAFMHEMYQLLFVDSGGKDIGIGAVPRDEYWPVISKWASER